MVFPFISAYTVHRSNPDSALAVLHERCNDVGAKGCGVGFVVQILLILITVETVESAFCPYPDVTVGIFQEAGDTLAGKVLGNLYAGLVCQVDIWGRTGRDHAKYNERKGYRLVFHSVKIMLSSQTAKQLNKSSESMDKSFNTL